MTFFQAAIPNTISAIKVGYTVYARYITIPTSAYTRSFLDKLADIGVITSYTEVQHTPNKFKQYRRVYLRYINGKSAIYNIIILSKSSKVLTIDVETLIKVMSTRRGVLILSTSHGVLTDREAIDSRVGGVCLALVLL